MKFGLKEKMRSKMIGNYPNSWTFKNRFGYFNEFRSNYCWIFIKITKSIYLIWNLVWLVKIRHSIMKRKKEKISK